VVIYKIQNKINGKIYIGQTIKKLSERIAIHIRDNKFPIAIALNK
jgi:predicted GIY-YIG superfamily endonuclease